MSDEVRRKLAAELRGLGLIRMARDAEHGYYSDFDSPLATPKMTLAQELAEAAGSEARSEHRSAVLALRQRVTGGEFDD